MVQVFFLIPAIVVAVDQEGCFCGGQQFLLPGEDGTGFIDDGVVDPVEGFVVVGELLLGSDDDVLAEPGDGVFEGPVLIDDELGGFGWCFGRGMRHEVGDRLILLVADAGDDRNGEFGDGLSDHVVVEDEEVGLCAAAADDDHCVIAVAAVEDVDQAGEELLGIVLALHDGKIFVYPECIAEGVVVEGMVEVLPAGGGAGGDDCDVLDDSGQGQLFVLCTIAAGGWPDEIGVLADEPGECGLALLFELAQGKVAVDPDHAQLEAEDGVVFDGDVDKNIYIIGKPLAGGAFKAGDAGRALAPGLCLYPGDKGIGRGVFFDQVEAVVVLFLAEGMTGDVCDNPEREALKGVVQRLRDVGRELGESYWLYQSKSLSGFGIKLRKAWKLALYFLLSSL
jgi:hypothetical protein